MNLNRKNLKFKTKSFKTLQMKHPKHRKYIELVCSYRAHDVAWDSTANVSCPVHHQFKTWNMTSLTKKLKSSIKSIFFYFSGKVSHQRARRGNKKIPPGLQSQLLRRPLKIPYFKFFLHPNIVLWKFFISRFFLQMSVHPNIIFCQFFISSLFKTVVQPLTLILSFDNS